jgi:radical SAM protein with 4Fe4S-binding SPASM domain
VKLKPSKEQFREAMTQIIQAKKDFVSFGGRIGFGTAIPYCLDERMVTEGLTSDCGVGSSFCAVNPKGEFRLCNQSQLVFGNVLEEPIEAIWNKKSLDIFRDLSWVGEPCKSCELLLDCTGGCKVDANCSDKFCIDYAVRGLSGPTAEYVRKLRKPTLSEDVPMEYRQFKVNRYTKANIKHEEKFLVTRYQTVKIDEVSLDILSVILDGNIRDERALVVRFADKIDEVEIRKFVSGLIQIGAIDPVGEVQDEGS